MKAVILHNLRDTIFDMKTNVLQDSHICITVPINITAKQNACLKIQKYQKVNMNWTISENKN